MKNSEEISNATPVEHQDIRVESLIERVEVLTTESIGQEHRLLHVFQNVWRAARAGESWPLERKVEAVSALLRYVFLGRVTVLITLGLGGFLALHASFMLAEQNRKLDLENYLTTISSELGEAQRNSQFVQLIAPLIQDLQVIANADPSDGEPQNRANLEVVPIDASMATRVSVLTQTFQPYRWIHRDMAIDDFLKPDGSGIAYAVMSAVRRLFDSAFGKTAMTENLHEVRAPVLTEHRLSPERGFLLMNLHALRIDFKDMTRFNVTFEQAYAPGARLEAIDIGRLSGPSLSEPIDLGLSELSNATFERANLEGVLFIMANLTLTRFDLANAMNASFRGANADEASFIGTNLMGTDFQDAYIGDANFHGADLTGADFSSARGFSDAKLATACISEESTKMPAEFDWSSYKVPDECCMRSSFLNSNFVRSAAGDCGPRLD